MKRKYRNAQDVLPDKLLRELQQYAAGETLYIPGIGEKKLKLLMEYVYVED